MAADKHKVSMGDVLPPGVSSWKQYYEQLLRDEKVNRNDWFSLLPESGLLVRQLQVDVVQQKQMRTPLVDIRTLPPVQQELTWLILEYTIRKSTLKARVFDELYPQIPEVGIMFELSRMAKCHGSYLGNYVRYNEAIDALGRIARQP
jgi:hypothetical protein